MSSVSSGDVVEIRLINEVPTTPTCIYHMCTCIQWETLVSRTCWLCNTSSAAEGSGLVLETMGDT